MATYDSNAQLTDIGTFADIKFTATTSPTGLDSTDYVSGATPWLALDTSDVRGRALPEPGSMALVGLGLLSLAGLRRRKQQA